MRDVFVARLLELARLDPRLVLITGDLGFGVLDAFAKELPQQYVNAGVAEQNMTAIACGMALEGFVPFTYSIGNFPTLRCLEQIRNDVAYHGASVKIVCIGGGFTYGQLGMSHHATEDLSILRALPNLCVVAPANDYETRCAVDALIERPGPAYLRIERTGTSKLDPGETVPFAFGRARVVRGGRDVTVIGCGGVVDAALQAAEVVAARGIQVRVISMHTVKPLDRDAVVAAARDTGRVITVEENTVLGGLGGAVAEVCAEEGVALKSFKRLGLADQYSTEVGDQQFLRARYGMDRIAIEAAIMQAVAKR